MIPTNTAQDVKDMTLQQAIDAAKQTLSAAAEQNDPKGVAEAQAALYALLLNQKAAEIAQRLSAEQASFDAERADAQALAQRGLRQLTRDETKFYQQLREIATSKNPQQSLSNANLVLPETVIERVFEDLRSEHPLLRYLDIAYTGAAVKFIVNTNSYQKAQWGELCDEIVKELAGGFKVVDTMQDKLSAFLPVCKQALILGPTWMDRYVRETLAEALANGLTDGFLNGTGNDEPIGMRRQVGDDVTVVGGVYPLKDAITVSDLSIETLGGLMSQVAIGPNGASRSIRDVILVCNPADRYSKVDPALLYRRPDGTYSYSSPWPMNVIDDPAVPVGEAVFGLGYRYAALVGNVGGEEGLIDYSDHFRFLLDQRVYLIKAFANAFPKDNTSFLRLDISGLQTSPTKVTVVEQPGAPALIVSSDISNSTDLLGKTVNNLQTGVVVGAANIGGTLKYVTGYTGFSGTAAEQSGNYLALHCMSEDGATIKAVLVGGTTPEQTLDADGLIVMRITSTALSLRVTATKNGVSTVKTYSLSGLTLTPAA